MLRSLRVSLGKQNKRLIQDLENFMKPEKGSTAHNTEYMRSIFATDYVCDVKLQPKYSSQPIWNTTLGNPITEALVRHTRSNGRKRKVGHQQRMRNDENHVKLLQPQQKGSEEDYH